MTQCWAGDYRDVRLCVRVRVEMTKKVKVRNKEKPLVLTWSWLGERETETDFERQLSRKEREKERKKEQWWKHTLYLYVIEKNESWCEVDKEKQKAKIFLFLETFEKNRMRHKIETVTLTPLKAFWEQQTPNKQQGKMVLGGQIKRFRKRKRWKQRLRIEAHLLLGSMMVRRHNSKNCTRANRFRLKCSRLYKRRNQNEKMRWEEREKVAGTHNGNNTKGKPR
jgi:hypothetical protein